MVQISTQSVLVILTSIQVEPWLVFAFIPALAGLIALRYFSIQAVRQLKRIENEKRSPLLGHVNTTAFGLVTISSFNQQDFFRERLENGTNWTNLIQNKLSHKSHYKKKWNISVILYQMETWLFYFGCGVSVKCLGIRWKFDLNKHLRILKIDLYLGNLNIFRLNVTLSAFSAARYY